MKPWASLTLATGFTTALLSLPIHPVSTRGTLPTLGSAQGLAGGLDAGGWTLVVGGDTDGFLSPCGCTSPMTGGIRRRATALAQIRAKSHVVSIDNGGLNSTAGTAPGILIGRQVELKAETLAQSLQALRTDAIAFTARDARLSSGTLGSAIRLSGGAFVSTSLDGAPVEGVKPTVTAGPFVIGSISTGIGEPMGRPERSPDAAVAKLLAAAQEVGKVPVLMTDSGRDAAAELARKNPTLGVVVYRRNGWPPDAEDRVGNVLLLTPGERGKSIVSANYSFGGFNGYRAIRLGPEFADDQTVGRFYKTYLQRVATANLLDQVPREPSAAYAGNASCVKCHASSTHVWLTSAHAHSLATLEKQGEERDPDCVSCHVEGLTHEGGFRSRLATPSFAFVGCESCHGPAKAHVLAPKKVRLPKLGEKICTTCHTVDQSPRFNFLTYWRKIAHK